jgi:hypothetical protein
VTTVRATPAEVAATMPGDDLVPAADVVMDRAFSLSAPPQRCWPWFVQLGKGRSGWYFPRSVERFIPRRRRAVRSIVDSLQGLAVGDRIDDWGGRDASFDVAVLRPTSTIVFTSTRGRTHLTWAVTLTPDGPGTRVRLRLRLAPVRRRWLANSLGGLIDAATIAGLAAGLRERLR